MANILGIVTQQQQETKCLGSFWIRQGRFFKSF